MFFAGALEKPRTWTSSALRSQYVAVSQLWMNCAAQLQKPFESPQTASAPCEPRCAPPNVTTRLSRVATVL